MADFLSCFIRERPEKAQKLLQLIVAYQLVNQSSRRLTISPNVDVFFDLPNIDDVTFELRLLWSCLVVVDNKPVDIVDIEKLGKDLENASLLEIMDRALEKYGNVIAMAFR
ncbi:hypothetical protein Tco_0684439 [Tanacetum coccineum]